MDGFQYFESSMSMKYEGFSRELVAKPKPRVSAANNFIKQFLPTREGFYDYENFRYIYQYNPKNEVRRFL